MDLAQDMWRRSSTAWSRGLTQPTVILSERSESKNPCPVQVPALDTFRGSGPSTAFGCRLTPLRMTEEDLASHHPAEARPPAVICPPQLNPSVILSERSESKNPCPVQVP